LEGRFRNRDIGVPKAFVFWKGGLGTDTGVPKAFVFWKGGLGTEILVFLRPLCFRRAV